MTPVNPVPEVESIAKQVIADAVKAAGVVLVVLGLLPVIVSALNVAHVSVPASLLAYATVATTIVAGFVAWANAHGFVSKVAARLRG